MIPPLVSVLMPAFNSEEYIVEAIESILQQTFHNFEFLIIDDHSTDRTWEIVQEYAKKDKRIIAERNEKNLTICGALNKGILRARGKYIARADSDDWSYQDRLEKQVKYMQSHPDVVISGGTMEICDAKLNPVAKRTYQLDDKAIRKKLFRYSPFCHPTTIYLTKIAKKAGMYDVNLHDAEDYDFYFRLGKLGKFGNISDTLYKYRVLPTSISSKRARRQELLTLSIRMKAVRKYGYHMTIQDKLYFMGQLCSYLLLPTSLRIKVFNLIRNS